MKKHGLATHGLSRSKVYGVWRAMVQRCQLKSCKQYHYYGGRGIRVCEKWQRFAGFFEDMGFPESGMTLERIDNDGNYCKENCRWVSQRMQANNKRNNVFLTFNGETRTIALWADKIGISIGTLWSRKKHGWPVEKMLTTPLKGNSGRFSKGWKNDQTNRQTKARF